MTFMEYVLTVSAVKQQYAKDKTTGSAADKTQEIGVQGIVVLKGMLYFIRVNHHRSISIAL